MLFPTICSLLLGVIAPLCTAAIRDQVAVDACANSKAALVCLNDGTRYTICNGDNSLSQDVAAGQICLNGLIIAISQSTSTPPQTTTTIKTTTPPTTESISPTSKTTQSTAVVSPPTTKTTLSTSTMTITPPRTSTTTQTIPPTTTTTPRTTLSTTTTTTILIPITTTGTPTTGTAEMLKATTSTSFMPDPSKYCKPGDKIALAGMEHLMPDQCSGPGDFECRGQRLYVLCNIGPTYQCEGSPDFNCHEWHNGVWIEA